MPRATAWSAPCSISELSAEAAEKGEYEHFMLKEIYEQPRAVANTLQERVANGRLLEAVFGHQGHRRCFRSVEYVRIVACGTSYHAGVVAQYFIEQICRIPCRVEIASEYRYRNAVVPKNSLFVTISQSGETADTLAALRLAQARAAIWRRSAICNSPESSLVRESELVHADARRSRDRRGVHQGLHHADRGAVAAGDRAGQDAWHGCRARARAGDAADRAAGPDREDAGAGSGRSASWPSVSWRRTTRCSSGAARCIPIALEGALKLKEISYIHAEAYAAGELKHGPLALVDEDMPVVAVAPNNDLLEKLKSNLMEVRARGGELYVFADPESGIEPSDGVHVIQMPRHVSYFQAPVIYTCRCSCWPTTWPSCAAPMWTSRAISPRA